MTDKYTERERGTFSSVNIKNDVSSNAYEHGKISLDGSMLGKSKPPEKDTVALILSPLIIKACILFLFLSIAIGLGGCFIEGFKINYYKDVLQIFIPLITTIMGTIMGYLFGNNKQ